MNGEIQLGLDVEFATKGDLQQLGRKVDVLGQRLRQPILDTLVLSNPQALSQMPAGGAAGVIWSAQVPPGEVWDVRTMTWWTADDHTAVANAFCASYIATGAGQLLGQLLSAGRAIPGDLFFPEKVARMGAGEQLVMLFYGVAAGQPLGGNARVQKWRDIDVQRSMIP